MADGPSSVTRFLHVKFRAPTADTTQLLPVMQAALPMLEALGARVRLLRNADDHAQFVQIIQYDMDPAIEASRQKVASDSPLPSGNAVAAMVLMELGRVEDARNTIAVFAQQLDNNAEGMSSMVQALALYLRKAGPFRISPQPGAGTAERPTTPQELAAGVVTVHAGWTPDRRQLHLVPLPVDEGQRMTRPALALGDSQNRGRVEAATHQHDRGTLFLAHVRSPCDVPTLGMTS